MDKSKRLNIELPDITVRQIEQLQERLGEKTDKAVVVRAVDWLWLAVCVADKYERMFKRGE